MLKLRFAVAFAVLCTFLMVSTRAQETEETETLESLVMWSSFFQPAEVEQQNALIDQFEEANPNIEVRLVVMAPDLMDQMLSVTSEVGLLPDIVLHPFEKTYPWYAAGYLNAQSATQLINEMGLETFSPAARRLLRVDEGTFAAIPSDGWTNLIVYRTDLFEEANLNPPDSTARIRRAARRLHNPEARQYGVCGPMTLFESTGQIIEFLALGAGTTFTNTNGDAAISLESFRDALGLYVEMLQDYGPPTRYTLGVEPILRYLAGECAMLFADPTIIDAIAGLQESLTPTCPQCSDEPTFLATNTGFVSALEIGDTSNFTSRGEMTNLSIPGELTPALQTFVLDYFGESYLGWLTIAPKSRQPLRLGTPEAPERYLNGWTQLEIGVDQRSTIADLYSETAINNLLMGLVSFNRLGATQILTDFLSIIEEERHIQQNAIALYNRRLDLESAVFNIERRLLASLSANEASANGSPQPGSSGS